MSSRDTEEIMLGGVRVEALREAPVTKVRPDRYFIRSRCVKMLSYLKGMNG